MVFVVFTCTSSKGECQKCSYGGPDLESCFKTLNVLVASGWQLNEAFLSEGAGKQMKLPVEAFDGELMDENLLHLQQTWETILKHHNYFLRTYTHNQIIKERIDYAVEAQKRSNEQTANRRRRVENLFERMDTIETYIQETKYKWGIS